ncbi:hypothetical protein [Microbispora rosea]|uniref:hypothetical protein n=1 Tax=Microbispora rosea TaxID=58117 RepID=UPI00117F87D7|nr:hypothetical protein [Microbispora rosea]
MDIGGDVYGVVIVGDGNVVTYYADRASRVEPGGSVPDVARRPAPSDPLLAGVLWGRDGELAQIDRWLRTPGALVQVHGVPGIGKSALLRRIAADRRAAGDEVVFLSGAGRPAEDLVQELFEVCYDSPDHRPSPMRLRRLMGMVRALIVVDDFDGPPSDLAALLDATPASSLLIGSSARGLVEDSYYLELRGLPEVAAMALVTHQAGIPLTPAQAVAARDLCRHSGGHPRLLLQAAAVLALTGEIGADPRSVLAASLDLDALAVYRVLGALPGRPVTPGLLAALAGIASAGGAIATLTRLRLVDHSGGAVVRSDDSAHEQFDAAVYASNLAAWAATATRGQIVGSAPAVIGVLELAMAREAYDPARILARTVAAALGRSLRWGAWGRVLHLGAQAAARVGAADDLAYFQSEENTRKRALGLAAGFTVGGAGAGVAIGTLGGKTGAGIVSVQSIAIAVVTAATVATLGVIGVSVATTHPSSSPAAYVTPTIYNPSQPVVPPLSDTGQPVTTRPSSPSPPPSPSPPRSPETVTPSPQRPPPDAGLKLSASSVSAGQAVTARATGFSPGEPVAFVWSGPAGSGQPATTTADAQGAAARDITPGTAPGSYTITATGSVSGRSAHGTVSVITLTLSPPSVAAGQKLTVSARGFDDGEPVTFTLDGASLGTVAAQAGGASLEATAPGTPGDFEIVATGRSQDRRAPARLQVTGRDLSGTWKWGSGSFELRPVRGGWDGYTRADVGEPISRCVFRTGDLTLRIRGADPNYAGTEVLWIHGQNGQNCVSKWAAATAVKVSAGGDRIDIESTSPFGQGTERNVLTR